MYCLINSAKSSFQGCMTLSPNSFKRRFSRMEFLGQTAGVGNSVLGQGMTRQSTPRA